MLRLNLLVDEKIMTQINMILRKQIYKQKQIIQIEVHVNYIWQLAN